MVIFNKYKYFTFLFIFYLFVTFLFIFISSLVIFTYQVTLNKNEKCLATSWNKIGLAILNILVLFQLTFVSNNKNVFK